MTEIYLVRHAQPIARNESTLSKLFSVFKTPSSALSDFGSMQALITAQFFRRLDANILLASPVSRALETAKIFSETLKLEVQVRKDLQEQDVGPRLKRVKPNDIPKAFPDEWRGMQSGALAYAPPGGESIGAFLSRVEYFLTGMESISGTVIAVTHFGFIQGVVCNILGLPFRYSLPLDFGEASITHVFLQMGDRVLVSLNETSHWEVALGVKSRSFRVHL